MDIKLTQRIQRVKPSPTLAVTQRAAELKAAGKDIVGLGAGEPDFDTPQHIKEAALKAMQEGKTKYTAVDGTPTLKAAIQETFAKDDLQYALDEIIVSTGAKQCIYNLLMALIEAGDEVVIPAPYWVSYPDMVLLADGKPVIIPTTLESRFKITPEQLDKAITPKTKLVMLNSPSNPSGMAYTRAELKALTDVLLKHPHVMVITDDIYQHILWVDEPFTNVVMVEPKLKDRTIVINGVSKAYAMTGWRIGYAAGPAPLIKAMKKIQGQSTSNACSIAQYAAEAALKGSLDIVEEMVKTFHERHDYVVKTLNTIPGVECLAGDGTFYAFPRVTALMEKLGHKTDVELAEYFINEVGLAMVPGSAFGCDGFLRLSFATSMQQLEKAMEKFKAGARG